MTSSPAEQRQCRQASLFCVLGLCWCVFLFTAGVLALRQGDADLLAEARQALGLLLAGLAGCLAARWQTHPYRRLGLIPFGALGQAAALGWGCLGAEPTGPLLLLAFASGLAYTALCAAWDSVRASQGLGRSLALGLLLALVAVTTQFVLDLRLLWVLACAMTVLLFCTMNRPALEQFTEIAVAPIYRFRTFGPGKDKIPSHGPLLVIANHTAYLDPLWLGKVLPRRIVPMMTSVFYDLPLIRPLVAGIVGAIRVQASTFRREAPELQQALAALERGECVVLFPEGRLRRDARPAVRQFGRGVWYLLSQRPQTPVVVCWIEGGWGSFTSYAGGPPLRNKRLDWWHRIDIGLSEPHILPEELLKDQRATRTHLMRLCLEARGYLGLEVPMLEEYGDEDDKGEAAPQGDEPPQGSGGPL